EHEQQDHTTLAAGDLSTVRHHSPSSSSSDLDLDPWLEEPVPEPGVPPFFSLSSSYDSQSCSSCSSASLSRCAAAMTGIHCSMSCSKPFRPSMRNTIAWGSISRSW